MILFLKHISIEGPGTIGKFFKETDEPIQILELDQGDPLPEDLSDIDAVISLGGPMNVYEEEKHPFLKAEDIFLKKVIHKGMPLLGICLGSQLIAKALGAQVRKAHTKEIGFSTIDLTPEVQGDALFHGLEKTLTVFQWHEDTFEIPKEGLQLAQSSACPHQAYRLGDHIYGLQFHIEVTDEIIESWIRKYFKIEDVRQSPEGQKMMDDYDNLKPEFEACAQKIYQNFYRIIQEYQSHKSQSHRSQVRT